MTKKTENELNDIVIASEGEKAEAEAPEINHHIEKLEKKIAKLEKKLEEQKELCGKHEQEKDEYINHLKKERAEFENFRKRKTAEAGVSYQNGVCDAVIKLLPLLDNLELAIDNIPDDKKDDDFIRGLINLSKLFKDTLNDMGIEEIEAHGAPFNHDYHDAMMQMDKEEGEEEGVVKQVLQKGYRKDDKVLRYAKVIVTK